MAVETHAPTPERGDDADETQSLPPPPSHYPPAPYDELFDVSTTIDPGYIISLIRKLIPLNEKDSGECGQGQGNCSGPVPKNEVVLDGAEESDGMDTTDYSGQQRQGDKVDGVINRKAAEKVDTEAWEESGCVLWDLSATKNHAEFMVQNLVLEVLLANLTVPNSDRVKEICLGIIGNLSCHNLPRKQILNTNGLVEMIVDQLYSDDTPCLCEVCRVITLGVQSTDCVPWAEALQSENILARVLWIVENALNPQLIERSVQLLLAIIESPEVVNLLLPPLIKLGLPNLLIKLLKFEMTILTNDRRSERYSVLEIILSTIEALSVVDDYSQELSSSKELFQQLCSLIRFPDKCEVANCCVSAAILIANILSDNVNLASELSTDLSFIQGLFDVFPFTSDDVQANSALWTILARALVKVEELKLTLSGLHQYVTLLVSNTDHIEDSLLDSQSLMSYTHEETSLKPTAKTITLKKIITILNCWTSANDENLTALELDYNHEASGNLNLEMENVNRLLECCRKYVQQ